MRVIQKPLELGADISLNSVTKYMNGHSDVVGGIVITNSDAILEKLRFIQNGASALHTCHPTRDMILICQSLPHSATLCTHLCARCFLPLCRCVVALSSTAVVDESNCENDMGYLPRSRDVCVVPPPPPYT